MATSHGIAAFFVRAKLKDGSDMMPLHEQMAIGLTKRQNVPMFGSEGGRLRQTCTDKWKLRAIRQKLRELGAKKTRNAVGIHVEEYARRKSGIPLGKFAYGELNYHEYQSVDGRKIPNKSSGCGIITPSSIFKWAAMPFAPS